MTLKTVITRVRGLLASRRFIACLLTAVAPAVVGLALWSWQLALVSSVTSLALLLITALLMQHGRRIFTRLEAVNAAYEAATLQLQRADQESYQAIKSVAQELRSEMARLVDLPPPDLNAVQRVASEMSEANAALAEVREQLADQWMLLSRLREESLLSVEQADARYASHLTIGDLDDLEERLKRQSAQIVSQGQIMDGIRHEIAQIEHRNYNRLDEQITSYEAAIDALRVRLVQLEARHVEETAALVEERSGAFATIREEIAATRQHAALHSSSLARLQSDDEALKSALEEAVQKSTQLAEELTQVRRSLPTADLNDERYAAVAETLISISQRIDELDDKYALPVPVEGEMGVR